MLLIKAFLKASEKVDKPEHSAFMCAQCAEKLLGVPRVIFFQSHVCTILEDVQKCL
jgi:hypothetical protein